MARECDQFELAVSAYLDGELPKEEVRTLFLHLADCEQCRAFMDTIRAVERRALTGERMFVSKSLDERIASIPLTGTVRLQSATERPSPLPSITKEHGRAHGLRRLPISYGSLARRSLLAAVVGFFLGVTQPWSYVFAPVTEPQILYVPMLPDIPVIGHVEESDIGGTSK